MLDKDKIIIIIYVGCGNVEDTLQGIVETQNAIKPYFDESVKLIFAPDYEHIGVSIDCINPVLLDEEEFKSVDKKIEKLDKLLGYLETNNE